MKNRNGSYICMVLLLAAVLFGDCAMAKGKKTLIIGSVFPYRGRVRLTDQDTISVGDTIRFRATLRITEYSKAESNYKINKKDSIYCTASLIRKDALHNPVQLSAYIKKEKGTDIVGQVSFLYPAAAKYDTNDIGIMVDLYVNGEKKFTKTYYFVFYIKPKDLTKPVKIRTDTVSGKPSVALRGGKPLDKTNAAQPPVTGPTASIKKAGQDDKTASRTEPAQTTGTKQTAQPASQNTTPAATDSKPAKKPDATDSKPPGTVSGTRQTEQPAKTSDSPPAAEVTSPEDKRESPKADLSKTNAPAKETATVQKSDAAQPPPAKEDADAKDAKHKKKTKGKDKDADTKATKPANESKPAKTDQKSEAQSGDDDQDTKILSLKKKHTDDKPAAEATPPARETKQPAQGGSDPAAPVSTASHTGEEKPVPHISKSPAETTSKEPAPESKPAAKPAPATADHTKEAAPATTTPAAAGQDAGRKPFYFTVQLIATRPSAKLTKDLSDILGLINTEAVNASVTRYMAGQFTSYAEANKMVRTAQQKSYAGAFIIAYENGVRTDPKRTLELAAKNP